jgi:hypothetical protein
MKEIKFSPSKLDMRGKEIDNPFDGFLLLSIPKYKDRIEIIQKMGAGEDGIANAAKMIDLVYERCKEVNLVHRGSKEEFHTLDDLSFTDEGSALINAAGQTLLTGYQLGNL